MSGPSAGEPLTRRPGAERLALAALTRVAEPGDEAIVEAVDRLGPQAVVAAVADRSLSVRRVEAYAARLAVARPDADLAYAERLGARFVCPGDAEWPSQLEDLGPTRPLALWVRGPADLRLAALRSVSVVGARASTAYGEQLATELAAALGERGWTVVSGAAYGIDAAAHRGALSVGGLTVAVLACGVDVAYPRSNEALLARVAEDGLVVSELAPGCSVTRGRFVSRNRVIAALTRGTVVVEAGIRSGALITARRAHDLGRHTMAVPGPVTSFSSAGCHHLLRTRPGSVLVTDVDEVVELVGDIGEDLAPIKQGPVLARDELGAECRRVLDALPVRRPAPVEQVARKAGLPLPLVLAALSELSALGEARAVGTFWRLAEAVTTDP